MAVGGHGDDGAAGVAREVGDGVGGVVLGESELADTVVGGLSGGDGDDEVAGRCGVSGDVAVKEGRCEGGVEDARVLVVDEVAEVENDLLLLLPEGEVLGHVLEIFPADAGRDYRFGG